MFYCWRWVIGAIAVVSVAGCAATGELFTPKVRTKAENGLIYIFRHRMDQGEIMDSPYIYINDTKITSLRKGGYTVVEATPGQIKLDLKGAFLGAPTYITKSLDINVDPGKNYYLGIRWYEDPGGGTTLNPSRHALVLLDNEERVLYELKGYRLQPSEVAVIESL